MKRKYVWTTIILIIVAILGGYFYSLNWQFAEDGHFIGVNFADVRIETWIMFVCCIAFLGAFVRLLIRIFRR